MLIFLITHIKQHLGYQSSQNSFFMLIVGPLVINEYWVLTAAHCVQGESASNTSIRVGASNNYASLEIFIKQLK